MTEVMKTFKISRTTDSAAVQIDADDAQFPWYIHDGSPITVELPEYVGAPKLLTLTLLVDGDVVMPDFLVATHHADGLVSYSLPERPPMAPLP